MKRLLAAWLLALAALVVALWLRADRRLKAADEWRIPDGDDMAVEIMPR